MCMSSATQVTGQKFPHELSRELLPLARSEIDKQTWQSPMSADYPGGKFTATIPGRALEVPERLRMCTTRWSDEASDTATEGTIEHPPSAMQLVSISEPQTMDEGFGWDEGLDWGLSPSGDRGGSSRMPRGW